MSSTFIGEIRAFGFTFAPRGWALCNGQLMSIAQNTALFSLLGTTYGGNGQTTFGLPDLRGRAALHFGQGPGLSARSQGEVSGTESHTLLSTELPAHNHAVSQPTSSGEKTTNRPAGAVPARGGAYSTGTPDGSSALTVGPAGGSQPHNNMQPYLVVNYCIALQGIFPSRN